MGGKRRSQPSGSAQGKQPSAKRQTLASAEEAHSNFPSFLSLLPHVQMTFSMRCDARALAGGQGAALEAALRRVVAEFGGQEFRLGRTRLGPSDDTLQRVLAVVVAHVDPESVRRCCLACKPWRRELETQGFCLKTFQLWLTVSQRKSHSSFHQAGQRACD